MTAAARSGTQNESRRSRNSAVAALSAVFTVTLLSARSRLFDFTDAVTVIWFSKVGVSVVKTRSVKPEASLLDRPRQRRGSRYGSRDVLMRSPIERESASLSAI